MLTFELSSNGQSLVYQLSTEFLCVKVCLFGREMDDHVSFTPLFVFS